MFKNFYGKLYMVTHVSEVLIVSRSRTFCNKGFEIIDSFLLSIVLREIDSNAQ